MPLVTVAMPARNAAAFITQAIASIQQQTDIEWELIVVDDASDDDTVTAVRAFDDPRIRLLRNEARRGIGYCHNRIVAASTAPFIAQVDADDYILRGALGKLVQALQNNPRAGQAYCQFYDIDSDGKLQRDAFARYTYMFQLRAQGIDYRRDLLVLGTVINALRTYPRHVLDAVGPFNEALSFGIDYDMALRIVDRYDIAFVPEFLYARRLHTTNTTELLAFKRWRLFWQRYQICRALARSHHVAYLNRKPYALNRLMLVSLAHTLAIPQASAFFRNKVLRLPRTLFKQFRARVQIPLQNALYEFAVNHGSWWRLHWLPRRHKPDAVKRIGYYQWRFPALSLTFIQRELQALRDAGRVVESFADEPGGLEDAPFGKTNHYLLPRDPERLVRAGQFFSGRRTLRYWNAFVYVVLHQYGNYKTWAEDKYVFYHAVELAYLLHQHNITHLHTPWADRTAFIALIAAALLDIPFSLEARAHELHRFRTKYALREKFSNAEFIVTNSDYNARAIETYLDPASHPPLTVIRELLPLEQFVPAERERMGGPFRIVCVARLIEEKGLVYLLDACAQLRARGVNLYCEIIGAPEEPAYTVYLMQLKRLYKRLQLQNCVSFRGAQPFENILDAYRRADLFVLPCVIAENGGRDISPNALIEAMAMGLPVISTQLGAIPEIVEHGVSGILVPPNDAAALANAMMELLQDESLRRELGARARGRVQAQYDAGKNVNQFLALFETAGQ